MTNQNKPTRTPKKAVKETKVVSGLAMLMEDELDKAQVLLGGLSILDKLQEYSENLAKLVANELLPSLDMMRSAFGPQATEQFYKTTSEAINQANDAIQNSRETINVQVDKLKGDSVAPANDMGNDMGGMDMGGEETPEIDMGGDEEPDLDMGGDEEPDLELGAAGRARKESVQHNVKALRESRNPDAMIFNAYRAAFRESRQATKAVQTVAESFSIDLSDVIDIVKEAAKSKDDPCWKDYKMVGMKDKGGKKVPNCVPVEEGKTWKDQKDKSNKRKDWSQERKDKKKSREDQDELEESIDRPAFGKRGVPQKPAWALDQARQEKTPSKAPLHFSHPMLQDLDKKDTNESEVEEALGSPTKKTQGAFGRKQPDPLSNVPKDFRDIAKKKSFMNPNKEVHEEKKPDADKDGIPDWADKNPNKAGGDEDRKVSEKFDMEPTPASKKGMFKGKTQEELRSMLSNVKKKMKSHEDRGEAVPKELRSKFSQLTFALRAKHDWGNV